MSFRDGPRPVFGAAAPPSTTGAPRERDDGVLPQGERRVATVLFADLAGYSRLAEELDPEELTAIMNRLLAGATTIIESHGGTVNQFAGDDVKALFGVPVAHDDDPRRAITAALELHRFVRDLGTDVRTGGGRLALHTAISTGVIVTQVRDQREGLFGVTGDTINTAARLVDVAGADEIVIDADTHRAVEPYVTTEPLGRVELRGKTRPVAAFRVLGAVRRGWFEVPRARGLSPYTGRDREQTYLEACVRAAREGHGSFIALAGEAGVGKSRCLYELQASRTDDVRVVLAGCDGSRAPVPFDPFLQLLRVLLDVPQADPPDAQRARVVAATRALGASFEASVPVYLQLLSLRSKEFPLPAHLQDDLLRAAMLTSLTALVVAAARERPLLVLLEDWHWADESSTEALEQLASVVASHPIVLVATYRPEGEPRWTAARPAILHLRPLDVAGAGVVVSSRLGAEALSAETVAQLHRRTGGNPLFLEEVCRTLAQSPERAELTRAVAAGQIPTTVQAVIRARIDRLSAADQDILRLASVLGTSFPLGLLAGLAGQTPSAVRAALAGPIAHELVVGHGDEDDAVYRFQHAITRDVAYDTLLRQHRRELHRRAGMAIEALVPPERLAAQYETLSEHYERGEDFARGAFFASRAGDKAAASFSLNAARTQYRRAIALFDACDAGADAARMRVDVSAKWAAVCVYQPQDANLDVLRTSFEIANRVAYPNGAARAVYWTGWFEHAFGNHCTALGHFERALELAAGDQRLTAQLHTNLGQSFYHQAQYARAADHLERAIALRRGDGSGERTVVIANALGYLGLVDAERCDFASAQARADEALAIVRHLGQRQLEASILVIVAYVGLFQGDWEACMRATRAMRSIADAIGAPFVHAMSRSAEGYARAVGLDDPKGFIQMRSAIADLEETGNRQSMSVNCGSLAEALALGGDAEEAITFARRALARAEVGDHIGEMQAHRALGIASARTPGTPLDVVRAHFETALRLADTYGTVRERTLTRLRYGETLGRAGVVDPARALLERARADFRTFAMPAYAAFADRALAELASRSR